MKYENKLLILCRGLYPPSRTVRQRHLDEFKPFPFLGINNITVPIQNGGRSYGWFTTEETSCTSSSIAFLNVDNSTLYIEVISCGIIYIPIIAVTFDNHDIHILHYLKNQYIYGYFILNSIGSEAAI